MAAVSLLHWSCAAIPSSTAGDSLLVMFWNVENFFDYEDGGENPSDKEFSQNGPRHWTKGRFYRKCELISKAIFQIAAREGRIPDVIGLAEVENGRVLRSLLSSTLLSKCSYRPVIFPSADPRGIDVSLLYNERVLSPVITRPVSVLMPDGERLLTRDILLAAFTLREGGDSIAITVNHHPSKYGGEASGPRRAAAVERLSFISDSLSAAGWHLQLHIGDFNDVPSAPVYRRLKDRMDNLAAPLAARGEGSIRFDGRWELIDQALFRSLYSGEEAGRTGPGGCPSAWMKVVPIPFLTVKDSAHSGTKPLRTYSGPRYIGGVSDHYPIIVWIEW